MSSVGIRSQVWLLELSVEFFNVNCEWHLAVSRPLPTFCHRGRTFSSAIEPSFYVKMEILMFPIRNVFWPRGEDTPLLCPWPTPNQNSTQKSRFQCFLIEVHFWPGSMFLWPRGTYSPLPTLPSTITHHKNQAFNVFCRRCSFDPEDTQADNFLFQDSSLRERELYCGVSQHYQKDIVKIHTIDIRTIEFETVKKKITKDILNECLNNPLDDSHCYSVLKLYAAMRQYYYTLKK